MTNRIDSIVRDTVEKIWNDVLDLNGTDQDASFFDLNGDSISAVRLAARIDEELHVEIDVADIFEDDPTLADLTDTVESRVGH
ncbi:phosphopantetheine-binding protein [Haloechinothrix halophila]|uniref:phosphopantetheine-binding protein n=1 Tax=Haloechinothrix halophila TaxID=1069073 RepID=UPI0003FA6B09|nr:phosphopantetheine-binding protein [Haloechinothrix halophila]